MRALLSYIKSYLRSVWTCCLLFAACTAFAQPSSKLSQSMGRTIDPELFKEGYRMEVFMRKDGYKAISNATEGSGMLSDYGDLSSLKPAKNLNPLPDSVIPPMIWAGEQVSFEEGIPFGEDDFDDGLQMPDTLHSGETAEIAITLNTNRENQRAYYALFLDWDNDGILEAGYLGDTLISRELRIAQGINVPDSYNGNPYQVRLRVAGTPLNAFHDHGTLRSGETEDYLLKGVVPLKHSGPLKDPHQQMR